MGNELSNKRMNEIDWSEEAMNEACKKAADAIATADIFLLATGAGFSADSGLAVYKDIANIEPYHKMKVDYSDLCVPTWITEDPEIFYGFWGSCYNDYRKTNPHKGYEIVRKFKEKFFVDNNATQIIQEKLRLLKALENPETEIDIEKLEESIKNLKIESSPVPGSFYIFTSNVDHHSIKSGFEGHELYEIHGNTEYWQCAKPCQSKTWKAPSNFSFDVDKSTMRAKNSTLNTPDISKGWDTNHPTCIYCSGPARPSILMFGDGEWISDRKQSTNYRAWKGVVTKLLKENPTMKLVILEMGCGIRVPTVRYQSESYLDDHKNTTLIRINPDYPLMDGSDHPQTISIRLGALEALQKIEKHIDEVKS